MRYDFDSVTDRRETGAIKWDSAPEAIKNAGTVPLTIADMEFKTAPEIISALREATAHGIFGYTYADKEYFGALKGFMKRRHGLDVEREWLLCTSGVVPALGIAVRALTEPGEGIVIQTPVYPPFYGAIADNSRVIVENPLKCDNCAYSMDFDDLETKCARDDVRLMILCNPHNPIGRVWTREELQRVHEITSRHGVTVISDEIHGELILPGNKHTSFALIDGAADNCVICTAMSKTFNLAGMMCSNIFVKDKHKRDIIKERLQREAGMCIGAFSRYAAIAAFTECDDWLDELMEYVAGNFEMLYSFIDERLPMLKYTRAEGTYLAWVDMRGLNMSEDELNELLVNEAGILLERGSHFGKSGECFMRINTALPRRELKYALERLEAAVYRRIKKEEK